MFSKAALSTSPRTAVANGFVRGSGIALGLAAALLLLSAPARADRDDGYYDQDGDGYSNGYDYAEVLSAEPNLRQVRVVIPRRECYTATRYVPADDGDYRRHRPAGGPMILGGLIGAVVGHQIGSGDARGLGTVAGAMIGGAVGHDIARRQADERDAADRDQDGRDRPLRAIDSERCETRYDEHYESRVESYRVTYRYQGRVYHTVLARDPGSRLRVRVAVTPEG
jgi:uncharacterized protein YcfJ